MDEKIAALKATKAAIAAVSSLPGNQVQLDDITLKLQNLEAAKKALHDSCCGQSCAINWND